MGKGKRIAILICAMPVIALNAQMRELSFYEVRRTDSAPVIDGKLDDPCWQAADRHHAYYEYFKPNPGPGVLNTEFRMLSDAKGIYLGIVNYEERIREIRKNITDRDNPQLWTDDCAEIYFDPSADSIGYTKFMVNAIATVSDMRRIDNAVSLPEWNGNGWHAAVSINADNWTIEAFLPWADLERPPRPAISGCSAISVIRSWEGNSGASPPRPAATTTPPEISDTSILPDSSNRFRSGKSPRCWAGKLSRRGPCGAGTA